MVIFGQDVYSCMTKRKIHQLKFVFASNFYQNQYAIDYQNYISGIAILQFFVLFWFTKTDVTLCTGTPHSNNGNLTKLMTQFCKLAILLQKITSPWRIKSIVILQLALILMVIFAQDVNPSTTFYKKKRHRLKFVYKEV